MLIATSKFFFNSVAPFAGAWIEIACGVSIFDSATSLPSRERGLKWSRRSDIYVVLESLPSRERGLKSRDIISI